MMNIVSCPAAYVPLRPYYPSIHSHNDGEDSVMCSLIRIRHVSGLFYTD